MIKIWADGAAKGNPGKGGYGSIVKYYNDKNEFIREDEFTDAFNKTTNNRMELMGVIIAMESIDSPEDIEVYSDSLYIVNAFNKKWIDNWKKHDWKTTSNTAVKNKDLWERLLEVKQLHTVKFFWVKGHAGQTENERCDYLASSSASGIKFTKGEDGKLKEIKEMTNV